VTDSQAQTVDDIQDCFCRTHAPNFVGTLYSESGTTCVLSRALEYGGSLIDDNWRRLIVVEGGFVYVPRTSFPDTTLSEDVEDFGVCRGHWDHAAVDLERFNGGAVARKWRFCSCRSVFFSYSVYESMNRYTRI